ncbi:hypothetical protein M434DRAFT_399548 [Hypoxylon sp. CO27-5]|nr:hypothetical protein M434DRAFT_399548 [Hypoxylon sp. CO27-5]
MICQNCTKSIRAASRSLGEWPREHRLHDSFQGLQESALAGCFICKRVMWRILSQVTPNTTLSKSNILSLSDSFLNSSVVPGENSQSGSEFDRTSRLGGLGIGEEPISFELEYPLYERGDLKEEIFALNSVHSIESIEYVCCAILFNPVKRELASFLPPIRHNPRTRNNSTADTEDLWRHWFRTCSESHIHCLNAEKELHPFLPERLIKIVDNGNDTLSWRMVHGSEIMTTPTPRYVTLSHCWGKSQHTKLQTQNYSTLQERQPDSDLPKTYRDALRVALSLGIQFIWIDSLCIIQDDEADWRSQSPLMGSIYHNACCNIAATWGADGDDGCFSNRIPYTERQIRIELYTPGDQLVEHDVMDPHSYSRDIMKAQLNTRGWVIQERYLARRQLSFTQDQVYWECPCLSASEQFPSGILGPMLRIELSREAMWPGAKPELDFSSELRLRQSWTMLVGLYSDCGFTKPSDRVFALAGLVSRVQQTTRDVYIAGLWKRDLHKQLCWYYKSPGEHCQDTDALIPTWSWLKMNRTVIPDQHYCYESTTPSYAKVIDVSGQVNDSSRFYNFATSTLTLRGIALQVDILPEDIGGDGTTQLDTKFESLYDGRFSILIHCDENLGDAQGDWDRRHLHVLLLWIWELEFGSRGLVLERLPNQEAWYRRLGLFDAYLRGRYFNFGEIVASRLGLNFRDLIKTEIDVEDERLKDLVHTVTLV